MNPTLSPGAFTKYRRRVRNPVKLTALLYLREALLEENYEVCLECIAIAKEFGALDEEIRILLENPAVPSPLSFQGQEDGCGHF